MHVAALIVQNYVSLLCYSARICYLVFIFTVISCLGECALLTVDILLQVSELSSVKFLVLTSVPSLDTCPTYSLQTLFSGLATAANRFFINSQCQLEVGVLYVTFPTQCCFLYISVISFIVSVAIVTNSTAFNCICLHYCDTVNIHNIL